jgi:hypothetical protein
MIAGIGTKPSYCKEYPGRCQGCPNRGAVAGTCQQTGTRIPRSCPCLKKKPRVVLIIAEQRDYNSRSRNFTLSFLLLGQAMGHSSRALYCVANPRFFRWRFGGRHGGSLQVGKRGLQCWPVTEASPRESVMSGTKSSRGNWLVRNSGRVECVTGPYVQNGALMR